MAKVKIYVGYGLGGRMWSAGMEDNLAKKLRALGPHVDVPPTHGWTQWRSVRDEINAKVPLGTKVVLIGHSMDGNAITWMADGIKRSVDLLVAYDPTVWSSMYPLKSNVIQAIGIHGNDPWSWVGKARLSRATGSTVKITTIETNDPHVAIDDDNALHAKTIAAVKELL